MIKLLKVDLSPTSIAAAAAAAAKSLQACPTLCDPIDSSPPGSPVPGILHARIMEWVAICFSNAGKVKSEREFAQLCPTLRDPTDCSLPGSSVHGIFQARVLEWVPSPSLQPVLRGQQLFQEFTVCLLYFQEPSHNIAPDKPLTFC